MLKASSGKDGLTDAMLYRVAKNEPERQYNWSSRKSRMKSLANIMIKEVWWNLVESGIFQGSNLREGEWEHGCG